MSCSGQDTHGVLTMLQGILPLGSIYQTLTQQASQLHLQCYPILLSSSDSAETSQAPVNRFMYSHYLICTAVHHGFH